MGGAGSAWIKPKKRRGLRPDALAAMPHPAFVRPGQRYAPRRQRGRSRVTLRIIRAGLGDERVVAQREDDAKVAVRLTIARLLATGADGTSLHYRFLGHVPGRRYATHAQVVGLDEHWARLVCPEWHPGLPITVAAGSLPPAERHVGAWLRCAGDLGAEQPAHVHLRDFAPVRAGFDPARYHAVGLAPELGDAAAEDASDPEDRSAAEDADIVLFASAAELAAVREGATTLYVTGNPPHAAAGARVYVYHDGAVRGWREVAGVRPMPNGVRLVLAGAWEPVAVQAAVTPPASGVGRDGSHGLQRWLPRDWARVDERAAS